MSFDARVYRVMIASPTDTKDIRTAVRRHINSWNDKSSKKNEYILLPFMWEVEAAASGGEGPQDAIERQGIYKDVDVLVGFFKERFGQPNGEYNSATEREIETFRKLGGGRHPGVLFPSNLDTMTGDEADKMRSYRQRLIDNGDAGLFVTYDADVDCVVRILESIHDQVEKLEKARLARGRAENLKTARRPTAVRKPLPAAPHIDNQEVAALLDGILKDQKIDQSLNIIKTAEEAKINSHKAVLESILSKINPPLI